MKTLKEKIDYLKEEGIILNVANLNLLGSEVLLFFKTERFNPQKVFFKAAKLLPHFPMVLYAGSQRKIDEVMENEVYLYNTII